MLHTQNPQRPFVSGYDRKRQEIKDLLALIERKEKEGDSPELILSNVKANLRRIQQPY